MQIRSVQQNPLLLEVNLTHSTRRNRRSDKQRYCRNDRAIENSLKQKSRFNNRMFCIVPFKTICLLYKSNFLETNAQNLKKNERVSCYNSCKVVPFIFFMLLLRLLARKNYHSSIIADVILILSQQPVQNAR
jgi:hypothetical protein